MIKLRANLKYFLWMGAYEASASNSHIKGKCLADSKVLKNYRHMYLNVPPSLDSNSYPDLKGPLISPGLWPWLPWAQLRRRLSCSSIGITWTSLN